ncbi:predicted protein [Sclerotinia sclerotiorum 1980 UF-70]|uniref:Glycosyl transferase family 25 domain-containing protein n=2 Tax=Sclerotinia sclerotiorum (strain ATCC 18683 / 1980 / Ss-1) TaxID=665079 RepID=A7EV53_SCLS1|nr:predicted protein [Sclerotinia sclerotiorum 1980 UF-70]APA15902.1 hypothetical protein sscle_15g106720 [Sclerotinia sclerotiorum 1980 UF-70]EDN93345.1 predicted protein [Sclerotinia sclerotiorum 1980 UF-70]
MSSYIRLPQTRWSLAVGGLCLLWILLLAIKHNREYIASVPARFTYVESIRGKSTASAVQNRTMGFGAILMAILPDRTDQIDTASLLSSYSDIDLTIIDGVRSVSEKTRPPGGAQLTKGQIGCWRAHMNMMRYVVDHRLETALILEADVDWDIRIKYQLEELGKHMPGASKTRPYGLEWDMLYTGPALHLPEDANLGPVIRYHDNTVGTLTGSGYDKIEADWVARDLAAYQAQDHQRIVHRAYTTYANTSYMVTLEGAKRILYQLGLHQQTAPIDVDFLEALHRRDINGLIVVPPLMQQWKTGNAAKDSDIEDPGREDGRAGSGPCIVQSVRASLHDSAFNNSRIDWIDRTDLTG